MLTSGEKCACKMLEELNVTQPTLSHHMTKLMMAGLVTSERRGIYVYYRTNTEFLRWLIAQIDHTVLT